MKKAMISSDPDMLGSLPAMRRASQGGARTCQANRHSALRVENGKVVNINPVRRNENRRRGATKGLYLVSGVSFRTTHDTCLCLAQPCNRPRFSGGAAATSSPCPPPRR